MPEKIEDQCANMFGHMKTIVEAGGGSTDEAVVLQVRPADVPLVLAAMAEGRIDLVGVPRAPDGSLRAVGEDGTG